MSGHIRKSTFNDNNNQSSDLFTGTIISKKELPAYATVGALNNSTLLDEASHTRHIQFPNKKK